VLILPRHLKPGYGWVEQVEMDFTPRCDDGSLPAGSRLQLWANWLMDATTRAYKPLAYNQQTRAMLQTAGFIEVSEQVIRVPFNTWPTDPHEIEMGRWYNLALCQGLEAMSLAPFTRVLHWTREQVRALCADVEREVRNRRYHVYANMHIITARRPA
jgi:hypothetical protein